MLFLVMANEDQGSNGLLMALLSRGLVNIGPVDRGVMFPMARLVYWDCRENAIDIVLQAGDSTETITIDSEMAKGFRADLRKLRNMDPEAVEKEMQKEYLQQVPTDGSKH